MRSVSLRLCDLQKSVIPIGYVDENLHTQVRFDCKKIFEEYPSAIPSLAVCPPAGETYPAIVTRDGDFVIWDVTSSDVTEDGSGEIQLTFVEDEVVAKSYVCRIRVNRSLEASAVAPEPIENWITQANIILGEIPQTITESIDEAFGAIAAEASTLTPGSQATAAFDSETKVLSIGVPEGLSGEDGYSPVRGVDYWTAADQQAMREDIATDLAAAQAAIAEGKADALTAIGSAGTTQVGNVNTAGTTQVGNVNTAGATQVGAVQAKGAEVLESIPSDYSELSDDVSSLKDVVFIEKNLINTSQYDSRKTSNVPTNNGDGTWTFPTTNYGTTIWASIEEVPAGTYKLQGIESYGYTFVTTDSLYSGKIAENRTTSDVEFVNPTSQVLYLGVRIDRNPSETHVFYPHISVNESNVVAKKQGSANAGKALVVDENGNVIPDDITIDVDPSLSEEGEAADAKATGDRIGKIEEKIQPIVHTIHHTIPVTGTLDGGIEAYMGVIIPRGSNAKITVSTDILYRGDQIAVGYNNNALMTSIRQTFSGHAFYDEPFTMDIPDGDSFIQTVRASINHIESTSGNIEITVTFTTGENLVGMENVLPYKTGKNLINPDLAYGHVTLSNGYTVRATSDYSVCWVPISAGETISFNKTTNFMVIVDSLYDGTYDPSGILTYKRKITNTGEDDGYVIFIIPTSDLSDLIAVSGEYATEYKPFNPIGGYVEDAPDRAYGIISMYYPDEGQRARQIDSTQMSNRLRFVHISDTHQSGQNPLRYADEFTDLSGAAFLTLTGDIVNNSIANDFEITADQINAMEKPCYICMGNHDVWDDTSPTQRYTKYFNPIAEHNGLSENVSYYAVDFADEHVKCIWLDIYELSTGTPSHVMSGTQIAWFFSQLDDAITKSYHVCVFMHEFLGPIRDIIREFNDWDGVNGFDTALKWILDTVAAFQNKETVTFTHNGDSYTHTFSGKGVFVAYFNGHAHWDRTGWVKDYNQFNVTVTRAGVTSEGGTLTGDKLGCAYNYVAIDSSKRKLSIMRVGTNRTIWGTDRLAFSIQY